MLSVSKATVLRYIRTGYLTAVRLPGGYLRIERDSIEELLRQGREDVEQHRPRRRATPARESLVIDWEARRVLRDGQDVALTRSEYKILLLLSSEPGKIFSASEILRHFGGGDEHTLGIHIVNLRRKLEPEPHRPRYVLTVRGMGYRFAHEAGQPAQARTKPAEPMRPTLVAAVIPNGDRVLMTRRRYSGKREMWSWPAGHVDPGEPPEDAVLRELNEELLVKDATVVRHFGDVDYHGDLTHFWPTSGGFRRGYRMLHYLVALSSSAVEVIDHEQLLEAKWLTLDQVREATAPFPLELTQAAIHFAREAISQSAPFRS